MKRSENPVEDTARGRVTRDGITLHHPDDFAGMHRAGRLAAEILDAIGPQVVPGATTAALDDAIRRMIDDAGARSATIGYRGYRHASCISVNHVVCHGIPGSRIPMWKGETRNRGHDKARPDDRLVDGDILNIDVTVILDGWYGDTSRMYLAGQPKAGAPRLIDVTHDALMAGIAAVRPGNTFGDIGAAIQRLVESRGMSVVRDFCGHGLGRVFHAPPNVLHYGRPGTGPVLEEGMFFTIEPMVNMGRPETTILDDEWTAVTCDKSLSAQFEHSLGVTADGCAIFTLSPAGRFHPTGATEG
ncbi:type I methionyl aminopeptidase [Rhodobaculum claviforme]|uniref:Methionine aminopeptidase n=1 Tax=Rhodobaculum claviforme TaxID=1549854 RepID=A0A934TMR0_9RHOB|nr:type I methionyl aminopeptidase [Rhodobaculum claviforme]MBK5927873.1 type I methionyl aminopeptidase [Rhodobaculum claviforme]